MKRGSFKNVPSFLFHHNNKFAITSKDFHKHSIASQLHKKHLIPPKL